MLKRVQKMGDLFEPTLKLKQKLPKLQRCGRGRPRPCGERSSRDVGRRRDWTGNRSPSRKQKKTAKRPGKKAASGKKPRKI